MNDSPDFQRLEEAISEALTALPAATCQSPDASLRRACHEVVLLLQHTRERVQDLRAMFAATRS